MVWMVLGVALAGGGVEPAAPPSYRAWSDERGVARAELIAEVPVAANRLWPALSNYASQHTWVPYMRTSSVRRTGPLGALCVGETDLPWPLVDRTWSVWMSNSVAGEPGAKSYTAAWNYVPESGNIRQTSGSWVLRERGAASTQVRLTASVDLGRPVPPALLRWAERRALPDLLNALLARVAPMEP